MQRVISSIVGLPILVLIVYFGGTLTFFLLAAIAAGICSIELKGMFEKAGKPFSFRLVIPFTLFLLLPFYLERYDLIISLLVFLLLCLGFSIIRNGYNLSNSVKATGNTLLSVIYVSFCIGTLILVRGLDNAGFFLFFVLAVTWSGDTLAYYTGTLWGKHPLARSISPKKTLEGAVGGLAGSIAGGLMIKLTLLPSLSITHCIIVSIICGFFGQVGDLVESAIKRGLGAKDSGTIIPGHGGLLDRIDGVLLSAPVFYFYYKTVIL